VFSRPPRPAASIRLTVLMARSAIGGVVCDDQRLVCEGACDRDPPQGVPASTVPAAKRGFAIGAPCYVIKFQGKRPH